MNKIVKKILRNKGFHGEQASDEQLYTKRKDGGGGLKSLIDV